MLAVALTVTCSHCLAIALSAQIIVTRSDAPAPAPLRTLMLVGWGATNPTVTEVDSTGTPVFELAFDPGIYSYRAFRFPWKPNAVPAMPIPQSFYLSQNFPNPFNSGTTIVLGFPTEVVVSFKVYDILGRRVMTVLDGMRRSPGDYYVHVDASDLPTGIYFYRVSTQQYSQMRKIIFMK